MTTLSCLVAWLLLYLFAFSSISQCNINGNGWDDPSGGRAIGQSEDTHNKQTDREPDQIGTTLSEDKKEEEGAEDRDEHGRQDPSDALSDATSESPSDAENVTTDMSEREATEQVSLNSGAGFGKEQASLSPGQPSSSSKDEGQEESSSNQLEVKPDLTPSDDPTLPLIGVSDTDSERSNEVTPQEKDTTAGDETPEFKDEPEMSPKSSEGQQKDFEAGKETNAKESNGRTAGEEINIVGDDERTKEESITVEKREGIEVENIQQPLKDDQVLRPENGNELIDLGGKTEDVKDEVKVERENVATEVDQVEEKGVEAVDGQKEQEIAEKKAEVEPVEEKKDRTNEAGKTEDVTPEMADKEDLEGNEDRQNEQIKTLGLKKLNIENITSQKDGLLDNGTKSEKEDVLQDVISKEDEKEEKIAEQEQKEEGQDEEKAKVPEGEMKDDKSREEEEGKEGKAVDEEGTKKDDVDEEKGKEEYDEKKKKAEHEEDREEEEEGKGEEMPSFGEWKQKMLQQAQETHDRELSKSGQGGQKNPPPPAKFNLNENSKNHASADCGAKTLGTNTEAQSASAILNSNRDVYMLNPCTAKIWFTVELCEPIQVKLIELANYELFSSVPERFRVSVSDRYPVREWHQLGTFLARDERALQSFPISEETMFAKYMKVEMLTFFGTEHFCPISVLRVFGTSMVEEIDEAENENSDSIESTEQDVLPVHPTPLPEDMKTNGILDHAKDAVFKFVEKAAMVLTGKKEEDEDGAYSENITDKTKESTTSGSAQGEAEGQTSDQKTPEDAEQASESRRNNGSSDGSFHDKCNGQAVCYQGDYSQNFQHCCISLFAQTAGSILICCRALRKGLLGQPSELDEQEGIPDKGKLTGSRLQMEVLETKMEKTQAKLEEAIMTSFVLEPTPPNRVPDGLHQEKIQTSSPPPAIVLSTKQDPLPSRDSEVGIKPTSTSDANMLRTSEPTETLTSESKIKLEETEGRSGDRDTSVQKKLPEDVGGDSDVDIEVLPVPSPPTASETQKVSTDEALPEASPLDKTAEVDQLPHETISETKDLTANKDTQGTLDMISEPPLTDRVVQPTEPTKTADTEADVTKPDAAKSTSDTSTDKTVEDTSKAEAKQDKDKVVQEDNTAKDTISAIPSDKINDTISKQAKVEQNNETSETEKKDEVPKTSDSAETPTSAGTTEKANGDAMANIDSGNGNGKVVTADGGLNTMGSFSPSASSLSGLGPLPHGTQKESVLMRLNNRIKALEINMSLSSLYLEELSQRYRKQMDDMQKAFNKKIKSLQENSQKAQEVEEQQMKQIASLEKELDRMHAKLENVTLRMDEILRDVVERHLFLMLCEVLVMLVLFTYCIGKTNRVITASASSASSTSLSSRDRIKVVTKAKTGSKESSQLVEDVGRRNSDGLLHVPIRDGLDLSPGLGAGLGMLTNGHNNKTGSLDDLLIIGPTTPLKEALRQASVPTNKQKGRNRNKGRHKNNNQRPASTTALDNKLCKDASPSVSSSSSITSLPSPSSSSSIMPTTKLSMAGLLFRGSAGLFAKSLSGSSATSPSVTSSSAAGSSSGSSQLQMKGKSSIAPARSVPENVGHQVNGVCHQGGTSKLPGGSWVNGYRGRSSSSAGIGASGGNSGSKPSGGSGNISSKANGSGGANGSRGGSVSGKPAGSGSGGGNKRNTPNVNGYGKR